MSDLQITGLRVGDWSAEIDSNGDANFEHDGSHIFSLSEMEMDSSNDLAALIAAVAKLGDK
jgi:hypothetical protein